MPKEMTLLLGVQLPKLLEANCCHFSWRDISLSVLQDADLTCQKSINGFVCYLWGDCV